MKTVRLLQSLTLALALVLGAILIESLAASRAGEPSPASALHPDWQIESVDTGGHVDDGTALALDTSTGQHPRIVYGYEPSPDAPRVAMYAWYDGAIWQTETVSDTEGLKSNLSLAIDSAGNPHVSYYAGDTGGLEHAWHDGAAWNVEVVDSTELAGRYSSLALDSSDLPHISYLDGTTNDLKYASYNGSTWSAVTVDSAGSVGQYTSLELDVSGRPHISYFNDSNDDLKYAWHDGIGWNVQTVDSTGDVGLYTSLELDKLGHPHISYHGGGLKYAWYDGASWHIEMIETGVVVGWYTSLALDGIGLPHISYYDFDQGILKYAWFDTQVWNIETVDTEGNTGWYTSLAVDEVARARISYYEYFAQEVKHARRLYTHLFLDKQAAPRSNVHNGDTLTFTLTFFGPGVDVELLDPLPDSVAYVTDSITTTVPPAAVYSPSLHAVAWKGVLPTDTIQVVNFQVTVDIPSAGPSSLAPTIVNTAILTDTVRGVSISATTAVNYFVYLPLVLRGG